MIKTHLWQATELQRKRVFPKCDLKIIYMLIILILKLINWMRAYSYKLQLLLLVSNNNKCF